MCLQDKKPDEGTWCLGRGGEGRLGQDSLCTEGPASVSVRHTQLLELSGQFPFMLLSSCIFHPICLIDALPLPSFPLLAGQVCVHLSKSALARTILLLSHNW